MKSKAYYRITWWLTEIIVFVHFFILGKFIVDKEICYYIWFLVHCLKILTISRDVVYELVRCTEILPRFTWRSMKKAKSLL